MLDAVLDQILLYNLQRCLDVGEAVRTGGRGGVVDVFHCLGQVLGPEELLQTVAVLEELIVPETKKPASQDRGASVDGTAGFRAS